MSGAAWVLGIMGLGLIAYTLGGGADFGGGMWDLLARGPRRDRQRALIAHAIAPIWEANHVWLIFVVVLCFSVFPRAFAAIATAFHIPLLFALIGIVLRGAAFTFRAYGLEPKKRQRWWRRTFAWSSGLTPLFLGATLAGLSSGHVRIEQGRVVSGFLAGWTTGFAWATGLFVAVLFAMLAAVYLTLDAKREGDTELVDDFRARAIGSELLAGAVSVLVLWRASVDAPALFENLLAARWSIPVQVATAVAAAGVIAALLGRRYAIARLFVIAQVTLVVVGWGLAMDGYLVFGALRFADAGARPDVVRPLLWAMAAGAVLLIPSLIALFRVFKRPEA